jgi:hypothetical protein
MGKRKYFIFSLILVICTLFSDFASKAYFSKSSYFLAKSLAVPEANKVHAKIQHDKFFHRGYIFDYLGIVLAVLSFAFWIASEVHHEPTWRLIMPALLIIYVLAHITMV